MGDGSSQSGEAGGKVAFIVLCQGHSGTTLLASLLDSHPEITCFDELFNDNSNQRRAFRLSGFDDPREYFRDLVRTTDSRAVGLKLPVANMRKYHPDAIELLRDPELRVIRLRRNLLAKIVSQRLTASMEGRRRHLRPYGARQVTLDPRPSLRLLRDLEFENRILDELARGHPTVQLTYEELLADPAIEHVQRFLGVDPRPLKSEEVKRRTTPLSETIGNWDEIAAALRGTALERYLDEPAP